MRWTTNIERAEAAEPLPPLAWSMTWDPQRVLLVDGEI